MAGISSHPVLRQAPSRSAFFCFFCLFVLSFLLRSSVYSPFRSVRSSVLGSSVSSPLFCPFSVMRFPRRKTFVSNSCVVAQITRYCQIFCHDARLFAKTLASWKRRSRADVVLRFRNGIVLRWKDRNRGSRCRTSRRERRSL